MVSKADKLFSFATGCLGSDRLHKVDGWCLTKLNILTASENPICRRVSPPPRKNVLCHLLFSANVFELPAYSHAVSCPACLALPTASCTPSGAACALIFGRVERSTGPYSDGETDHVLLHLTLGAGCRRVGR